MAYFNSDDENENAQGMNQQPAQPQLSGGMSGNSSASTGAQAPAPKATSSGMSSFQNIQKANQGQATDRLNTAAGSNVANQAQKAKTSINQATTSFGQKVDLGSLQNRENAVDDVKNAVNQARQVTTDNSQLQQPVQNRFQEVINAKYQGPESLRQSGDYQNASGNVKQAQNTIKQTENAQGREELLKNLFSKGGNYTQGLNKLDAGILNASSAGVQNIQDIAKAQGNIGNQLDQAQLASANLAQNRTKEIRDIRGQARNEFTQGKAAEEAATEARLASVIQDWNKLPDYFKDIIRNKGVDNKTILADSLNKIKTDGNLTGLTQTATQQKSLLDSLQKQLDSKFKMTRNVIAGGAFGDYTKPETTYSVDNFLEANPGYSREKAQAEFNALQAQMGEAKKAYSDTAAKQAAITNSLSQAQSKFNNNAVILNPFEAAILGVNSGEGLYNMGADAIKVNAAEKDRLISKDEQLRQSLLAQLGGLDETDQLSTTLKYANADKAGTQTALDALDLAGTRAALNESEQDFRDLAGDTTLVGSGKKKVSRGNAWGKKTKTYRATQSGNVEKMLASAGYDFNSPIEDGQDTVSIGQDLLKAALKASSSAKNNADAEDNAKVIGGGIQGGAAGASLGATAGSVVPGIGTAAGAVAGGVGGLALGSTIGAGTVDPYQKYSDLLVGMGGPAGELGGLIQDGREKVGQAAGAYANTNPIFVPANTISQSLGLGNIGSGISGAIGGISSSAMKSFGSAKAKQNAQKDLQKKYTNFLKGQGFENRFAVAENDTVKSRINALEQLLANLDKTNTEE